MSIKYSPWSNEIAIYVPETLGISSSSSRRSSASTISSSSRVSNISTTSNNSAGSNNSSISSTSPGISSSSIEPTSISKSIYFDYNNAPLTQKYSVSDNRINNVNQGIDIYYTGNSTNKGGIQSPGILFHNFGMSLTNNPLLNDTFQQVKTFDAPNVFAHPIISEKFINNENVDITLTGIEESKFQINFVSFFVASGRIKYEIDGYKETLNNVIQNTGIHFGGPDTKGPGIVFNKLLVLPNLAKLNQTISNANAFSMNLDLRSKLIGNPSRLPAPFDVIHENCSISGYSEPFLNKNITIKFRTINRPIWGNSFTRSGFLDENKFYLRDNNWGWPKNDTNWHNLKLDVTTADLNNNTFIVNCTPSLVYRGLKWRFSNIESDLSNLNQYLYSHDYLNNSDGSPTGIEIKTNYGITSNDNSPFVGYINYKPYVLGMSNYIIENHPYYGCKLKIERN
jgi:hypothetical protein